MSMKEMLQQRLDEAHREMRKIAVVAAGENRSLTRDEESRSNELFVKIDTIRDQMDALQEREATGAECEEALRKLADSPRNPSIAYKSAEDRAIEDKFRSAILEKNPAPIIVRDQSPRSYFNPGLEKRAISTTAPADASMGVGFSSKLLLNLVESSAILRAGATVIQTETGEPLRVPRQTAYSNADIVAENAQIPEADPTYSTVTFGAYKFGVIITVSNELVQDASFDLSGYLAQEAGVALGNAFGRYTITGTGTGQPRGVLTDATVGVTGPTGTASSFGAQGTAGQGTDLLNSLVGSLAEPYTRSPAAGFLLRTATLTSIRNLKSTQGVPVGADYIADSGYPFHVDPNVDAMAASAKSVIYGDWRRYFVRMVNEFKFEMSREFKWDTDQTSFRATMRADGALVDNTGAIKVFQHSAT